MRISVLDQSPVPEGATPAEALRNTIELARHADRLGYHRFWIAERHGTVSHGSPAPEVLVARVAAETSGIRVGTGGVLLSLYQPLKVAEVARVLHALHPGRIDLGIGRSPGGLPLTSAALGQVRPPSEEEFQAKLTDLLAFLYGRFPDGHPYCDIEVVPWSAGSPPVWLLGSSVRSAVMAGRNGLPYSYAQFVNPAGAREAIAAYRASYVASEAAERPQVILGIGVYCADTEQLAQRGPDPPAGEDPDWPRYVVGTPEQVRDRLVRLCSAPDLGDVNELVVLATIHDHKARLRSYELLAEAFDLSPRYRREP